MATLINSTRRAVDKVVAQVSNLLYRRASSLHAVRTISRARRFGRSADWKSAIQQVGNLRYAELAGLCQWPWVSCGQASLRDASGGAIVPWAEAHGYRRGVATRRNAWTEQVLH